MRPIALLLTTLAVVSAVAPTSARADTEHVLRAVVVMRHGVRPPNSEPPVAVSVAPDPWPQWETASGWLTDHGAAAIRLVARADAQRFAAEGLLPADGCPAPGALRIVSDSPQRTIRTGDEYASAIAPGCGVDNQHQPQGSADPLFEEYRNSGITAEEAGDAIAAAIGPDGIAALAQRFQPQLDEVSRILCGDRPGDCGLIGMPSGVEVDPSGARRPRLTGALDRGSVVAEVLELQYAEGKPMSEVGWGRASAEDIRAVGALHALELSLIARPRPLALANAGKIAEAIRDGLSNGPPLTVLVGHDTEIANLAGLLDVHWSVPGFADDEPAPGGALVFELVEDADGNRVVRSSYRAQTLDQIRDLDSGAPVDVPLTPAACDTPMCAFDTFTAALTAPGS